VFAPSKTLEKRKLEEVASNFMVTDGSTNGVQFIKGDVMETLLDEANIPQRISLLRLDTDWYESTLFELQVLYDRVQLGGVVILDDYGYWDGARSAVEEFFLSRSLKPLVHIIDDSGRVFVKTQG
jgi:O-methyltransferase